MINPIGTFVTHTDAALVATMNGIIGYETAQMATPVAVCGAIYYAIQGLRLVNGDPEPLDNFVPNLIRVGTVIWLSSNLSAFNQWVTNIFFTGLPNALAAAVGNGTTANNLTTTAAAFDNIYDQICVIAAGVWQVTGMNMLGLFTGLTMILVFVVGFISLGILVIVYEVARMALAAVICLGPVIIGCAMFDATKPIFERAMGKVVALILLQTMGLIVMQLVLMGDQWFVAQIVTTFFNQMAATMSGGQAPPGGNILILIALLMWFFAGAMAMYNLPALAYSIGAGIPMRGPPLLRLYQALRPRRDNPPPSGGGGGGGPPPPPNLAVSPRESGGDEPFVPPPPPPPLHLSTGR
jgi:type IV secretory pathway VirB6-like protein